MSNRIPEYLKLFKDDEFKSAVETAILPEFERLWSIFPEVTGLRLKITERQEKGQLTFPWTDSESTSYKVAIEPTKRAKLYSLNAAKEMESAFSELLTTLSRARSQLRQKGRRSRFAPSSAHQFPDTTFSKKKANHRYGIAIAKHVKTDKIECLLRALNFVLSDMTTSYIRLQVSKLEA